MNQRKYISLVVPVYNEEDNILHFYQAVREVMKPLPYHWELIFVDDGSRDGSRLILNRLAKRDEHIRALFLTRNYGHQTALTCGLDHAEGDAVISLDGDMQHPPELIPALLEKWQQGFDVVQTVRRATEDAGMLKRVTSAVYYKMLNLISSVPIREGGSDFRLLDREVVLALRCYREHVRFLRGLVPSLGFRQTELEFTAPPRFAGESKYSPKKMLRLALDGVFTCSTFPLRLGLYAGLVSSLFSVALIIHVLYEAFVTGDVVSGWSTIVACGAFFGGVQLMIMGVIGEYVGRVYEETKHHPLYLLEEREQGREKRWIEDEKTYRER